MNYTIRRAIQSDIPELVNLCAEHAEYERANYSREGKAENLHTALFSDTPRFHCLMVVNENGILGYASYTIDYSTWDACLFTYMDCLYLRPDYRGFGIGEALIHEIEKHSREKGISLIQWHTPDFNTRAIKFYHRIGATSKEKTRFYYEVKKLNT